MINYIEDKTSPVTTLDHKQPDLDAPKNLLEPHDSVIFVYRWAVLATHFIVFLYFVDSNALAVLNKNVEPLCWPYLQNCSQFRFDSDSGLTILMLIQFCLIVAAACALVAKSHRAFWIVMIALNVFLFGIVSLDYRLRANEFYMLFWLNAVFLFWPVKRWAIPLTLLSFYFWAGTLKLNYEWLSGTVLYHNLYIIPPRFAWAACAYVVFLEMIVVWGLIAKRAWIRWLALGQLALFHIESISQISWFYPVLMTAMLSWFLVDWTLPRGPRIVSLGCLWRGRAPLSAYVLLALFSSCQLMPYFYHGRKSLTGQGRLFALHMFESRPLCEVHAVIHYKERAPETVDLLMRQLPPRAICDPIVYYDRVNNLCRSLGGEPGFADADFIMRSKLTTDKIMTTIVDDTSFCSHHEAYRIFSNNGWIK